MKRIAIVTGASSGMGREFVLQLSNWETFDEIWAIARRAERLEELAQNVPIPVRPIALDLTDPDAFEASFFLRTKLDKAACEQALGEIRWLPDQTGFHGGFTGKTCKKAIAAAGLALDAVWPVLE